MPVFSCTPFTLLLLHHADSVILVNGKSLGANAVLDLLKNLVLIQWNINIGYTKLRGKSTFFCQSRDTGPVFFSPSSPWNRDLIASKRLLLKRETC